MKSRILSKRIKTATEKLKAKISEARALPPRRRAKSILSLTSRLVKAYDLTRDHADRYYSEFKKSVLWLTGDEDDCQGGLPPHEDRIARLHNTKPHAKGETKAG